VLAVYLVAGVLVAPLAVAYSVDRARLHETAGITPVTLRVTTTGHSELRLGLPGTIYLPRSRGPLGVVATVDGPGIPDGSNGDLASYVTPHMLALYTGLFHDPTRAVATYVDLLEKELLHEWLLAETRLGLVTGTTLLVLLLVLPGLRRPSPEGGRGRPLAAVATLLAASLLLAGWQLWPSDAAAADTGAYEIPGLEGTPARGATTDSALLEVLLGGALPKVETLVDRQERQVRHYRQVADASLASQESRVAGPRPGEVAVLMESDMHCNTTMIRMQRRVVDVLRERFGADVPALMAVTGDLTTNGTAAEDNCIRSEAAIPSPAPVAAVTGNHESDTSELQMRQAGMHVLDEATQEVGGVRLLGDGDPERTQLFGATVLRGEETEEQVGARLRERALDEQPQLVLVHEAYAAQAFVGVEDMRGFLDDRGSRTRPYDDGVRDLPASAVLYGHWHRQVAPRVVWNSDGTWTLVMELDTSGGAIATPTLGHFSTPWSTPQQEASFPVLFLDRRSGLVTGYQLYRFHTDGTVQVRQRVEVGAPGGTVAPGDTRADRARR